MDWKPPCIIYICCKITQQPELSVGRNVELHSCVVGSLDINICSYIYIILYIYVYYILILMEY